MENRVRTLRKSLRMTQEDFGEQLGVTKLTVLRWERDNKIPETSIRLICRIFQVNRSWLETGEGEMFICDKSPDSGYNGDNPYSSPYGYALQQGFPVEFATVFARLCELSPEEKKSLGCLISKTFSLKSSACSGNVEDGEE